MSDARPHTQIPWAMYPVYILWIAISGWVYREQSKLIEYLQAENRALPRWPSRRCLPWLFHSSSLPSPPPTRIGGPCRVGTRKHTPAEETATGLRRSRDTRAGGGALRRAAARRRGCIWTSASAQRHGWAAEAAGAVRRAARQKRGTMERPQSKKKQTQVARRPRRRGRWVPRGRLIAGRDFPEFLQQAVLLSGSLRQAARKLRVSYSTLRGWLGRRCDEPSETSATCSPDTWPQYAPNSTWRPSTSRGSAASSTRSSTGSDGAERWPSELEVAFHGERAAQRSERGEVSAHDVPPKRDRRDPQRRVPMMGGSEFAAHFRAERQSSAQALLSRTMPCEHRRTGERVPRENPRAGAGDRVCPRG
ncbi:hypothetical protein Hoch_1088 [Haliangium ochraceum DSM 14365]|uniref:Uncharacterized protein n=1 Tax=Haliangium ochraceum (strain DSM 14365 / JCM 11303 / SMP-2) TaxID=502025 RepID=D0LRX9_HALO1|nr:hypothetical protein Hoch_1088 [Haliangium ochraceum DSM 14365]